LGTCPRRRGARLRRRRTAHGAAALAVILIGGTPCRKPERTSGGPFADWITLCRWSSRGRRGPVVGAGGSRGPVAA
jgi:hypothetical protein